MRKSDRNENHMLFMLPSHWNSGLRTRDTLECCSRSQKDLIKQPVPPSSGEQQPPLSSDSDMSIVTGMEVGVSDLGLSLEPESEVFAKSWTPWTSDEKVHAYRTPTTSVNTCSSSLCRPNSCSLFPTSKIPINVATSSARAPKPVDVVRGAAWVPACCCYSPNKTEAGWFWCKITANTHNFDCCHGYQAHVESISAAPENWCELLPAIFPNVVICKCSQRSLRSRCCEVKSCRLWYLFALRLFLRGNNQTPGDFSVSHHPRLIWCHQLHCPNCCCCGPSRRATQTLASTPKVAITACPNLMPGR